MLIRMMNVDQKKLETEFLIAISRPTGNKWQSKTLVVAISDPRLLIKSVFDCTYPVWKQNLLFQQKHEKCKLLAHVSDCILMVTYLGYSINTPDGWQLKTLIISTDIDLRL